MALFNTRSLILPCLVCIASPAFAADRFHGARARAQQALDRLPGASTLLVRWSPLRTRPSMIRNLALDVPGVGPVQRARRFLRRWPDLFVGPEDRLRQMDLRTSRQRHVVRFQQTHAGIDVDGATIAVALDPAGRIRAVHSSVEPVTLPRVTPSLGAQAAVARARSHLARSATRRGARQTSSRALTQLVILPGPTPHLAYRILLPEDPTGRFRFIDAHQGQYLGSRPAVIAEVRR